MKTIGSILAPFSAAVLVVAAASASFGQTPKMRKIDTPLPSFSARSTSDTITYPADGYKLNRRGDLGSASIADSLLAGIVDISSFSDTSAVDDSVKLSARDTIFPPDSLRETDPFRYKYYVALIDPETHDFVSDSLLKSYDSLSAAGLTELARLDSLDRVRLDSTFTADALAAERAAFLLWYNSLTPDERKAYDLEQKMKRKLEISDSLKLVKDSIQARKDSILENTPRILSTFAIPGEMQYKRIIHWTVDQDFHDMDVSVPDTSYNYYFHDFEFLRRDVNASWLGVAGSPVQYYNWFNRRNGDQGIDFYEALESWTYDPSTIRHYNSKTPHTELAYWGTLFSGDAIESDNVHIFTTQNITPEFNFSILFNSIGGAGILDNEKVANKTFAPTLNYMGKKYLMHFGLINNKVTREENGGIADNMWIRDTTVEPRYIPVNLSQADSKTSKTTIFLDQQFRIPFDFLSLMPEDSSAAGGSAPRDTLVRDITTLFLGHSSEFTSYKRQYHDQITSQSAADFFNNDGVRASNDSLGAIKLDNKVFFRFQPFRSHALVSKISAGAGDLMMVYQDSVKALSSTRKENSFYIYGGADGYLSKNMSWNAKAKFYALGTKMGDFDIDGALRYEIYPFRRAKGSPVSFNAGISSSLTEPGYFKKHLHTQHYSWDNSDFTKESTTRLEASVDIPYWKFSARVGYAILAGNTYYDTLGFVRQNTNAMTVLSASIRKDFVVSDFLHLENRLLFQHSSCPEVIPLPTLAANLRYYVQFPVRKDVLTMQIGADMHWNTRWYSPGWNPVLGVFHNQNRNLYNNGPWFDAFINMQWKKACIFVKYENAGLGWPMERSDFFCADHYTISQRSLKLGIFWPFFIAPETHSHSGFGEGIDGMSLPDQGASRSSGGSPAGGRNSSMNSQRGRLESAR